MHFGENQLSPGLISLSLRPTGHPLNFQLEWVRSSTKFYQRFNLPMGSSPGFGSAARNCRPVQTRFPCGSTSRLNLATNHNSLTHYAKGTRSRRSAPTVCKHTVSGSFHSPLGVLFTFPSRYSFTIGHQGVLSLGRWSSQIPAGFPVPHRTQVPGHEVDCPSATGVSPSSPNLPRSFA